MCPCQRFFSWLFPYYRTTVKTATMLCVPTIDQNCEYVHLSFPMHIFIYMILTRCTAGSPKHSGYSPLDSSMWSYKWAFSLQFFWQVQSNVYIQSTTWIATKSPPYFSKISYVSTTTVTAFIWLLQSMWSL